MIMITKLKNKFFINLKDRHFSEVLKGSALSFGIKILTVILGLITNYIIANYYGAEVIGTLAFLMSIMTIASMITLMGMDVSVLRLIPPLLVQKKFSRIRDIIKIKFIFIMSLSVIVSILIYFSSSLITDVIFNKPNLTVLISLISYFIFFQVVGKFTISTIRALKNIKAFLILQFLPSIINLLILLSITISFYNLYNPIYSQITTQVIIAIISLLFLRKHLNSYKADNCREDTISLKEIVAISFPMFLTSAMQMVVLQTDILMLSSMSTLTNVGIYSIVMKLALLTSFIINSVNTIVAPKFSELYYNNQLNELKKVSKKSTKLVFFATIPVTIVLILFSDKLLSIFGDKFIAGSFALILLAIGQLVNAMAGSVGYFLNMTGHQKTLNKIVLFGALCNVILNILLIPNYGIEGAAFASMSSMIIWNIIASVYIKKQFGFYISYIPFIKSYIKEENENK